MCVMVIPTTTVTTGEILTGKMEFTDVVQLIKGVTNYSGMLN